MIHLTLSGYEAGHPLCGINKQSASNKGDTFVHYSSLYYGIDHIKDQLCPACKHIYYTQELIGICDELLDYRKHNTTNFQVEKLDDYLVKISAIIKELE
jgi:hypothetical protein